MSTCYMILPIKHCQIILQIKSRNILFQLLLTKLFFFWKIHNVWDYLFLYSRGEVLKVLYFREFIINFVFLIFYSMHIILKAFDVRHLLEYIIYITKRYTIARKCIYALVSKLFHIIFGTKILIKNRAINFIKITYLWVFS